MEILFEDRHVVVAVKPRGVLSEYSEQEENMVTLLGGKVYPVHRLDRTVGGVMVYAKTQKAAAVLSAAIGRGELHKEYTAVVTGTLPAPQGELHDLLFKDSRANKSYVVQAPRKGAKEALLSNLRSTHDSPGAIEGYYASAALSGIGMTPDVFMEKIRAVTVEDAAQAARTLQLNCVYFLKGVQ